MSRILRPEFSYRYGPMEENPPIMLGREEIINEVQDTYAGRAARCASRGGYRKRNKHDIGRATLEEIEMRVEEAKQDGTYGGIG